jgi:hypothetical protein
MEYYRPTTELHPDLYLWFTINVILICPLTYNAVYSLIYNIAVHHKRVWFIYIIDKMEAKLLVG